MQALIIPALAAVAPSPSTPAQHVAIADLLEQLGHQPALADNLVTIGVRRLLVHAGVPVHHASLAGAIRRLSVAEAKRLLGHLQTRLAMPASLDTGLDIARDALRELERRGVTVLDVRVTVRRVVIQITPPRAEDWIRGALHRRSRGGQVMAAPFRGVQLQWLVRPPPKAVANG